MNRVEKMVSVIIMNVIFCLICFRIFFIVGICVLCCRCCLVGSGFCVLYGLGELGFLLG